jgi:two-component system chemotaxis response regulator CheY
MRLLGFLSKDFRRTIRPCARLSTSNVPTTIIDPSASPPSRPPHGRQGPARVLYAEDLRELREVMRVIVETEGYHIDTVSDGDEALERLREDPSAYDLLITDHHMPRMNGLELVHQVVKIPFPGRIMVFSSELDPAVHREYHRAGAAVILPKPVRPAVLRKALLELLAAQ